MRKVILGALLMVCCAAFSFAQDTKKAEGFVGYSIESAQSNLGTASFTALGLNQNSFNTNRRALNGFEASGTGYFGSGIGLTADFSAHFKTNSNNFTSGNITSARTETQVYNILGGPQIKARNASRLEPFGHALFGIGIVRNTFTQSGQLGNTTANTTTSISDNNTDFAMALGGGLDVRLNDRIGIRAVQIDYNPIFQRDRTVNGRTLNGQRQDNVRFSFGVTF